MSGSFESVRWNACVHKLDLGLYCHTKEFWGNGVRTQVNSKGKIPSTGKILLRGGSNPRRCIKQDSEPKTLPTSYSGPQLQVIYRHCCHPSVNSSWGSSTLYHLWEKIFVFGPTVWNSLPLSLRKTQRFTTFKTRLKIHLFHIHLC